MTAFADEHPQAAASLTHWYEVARKAEWTTPAEVAASFSKAKVINFERVRFEVAGGDFRLIVAFDFKRQTAFMKFLGTHAEYDRIDAATVSKF